MGILKRVLFALGMLLCIYPIVRQHITKVQAERIVYEYQKKQDSEDVIGVISIPQIDVLLPIYEGTTEAILQEGVGHMEVSSALSGGIGTHCLLAGHRGLPNAELFRRLGELKDSVFLIYWNLPIFPIFIFKTLPLPSRLHTLIRDSMRL